MMQNILSKDSKTPEIMIEDQMKLAEKKVVLLEVPSPIEDVARATVCSAN